MTHKIDRIKIQRALISVSDKKNLLTLAAALRDLKVEIISTGGTAQLLRDNNIPVIEMADYTQFPEMLDGRVKTLHPKIHAGILNRRAQDKEIMEKHQIPSIDLVVVNLYPFEETIAKPNVDLETAIENIDIGGPSLLRAAAKNHPFVTVVSDPNDYDQVITEMQHNEGATSLNLRFALAQKVFSLTGYYDAMIANYLQRFVSNGAETIFAQKLSLPLNKQYDLRYGENPQQKAAFYAQAGIKPAGITAAKLLQGKPLSYNNIADADTAWECVNLFNEQDACVIVKHANPCGVAIANQQLDAYNKAFQADPTSAFGGIIAFNRLLKKETVKTILEKQFVEVIIAPEIENGVLEILSTKPNVRLLTTTCNKTEESYLRFNSVTGGMLAQENDQLITPASEWQIVSKKQPTAEQIKDLDFAWKVVKFIKSNAIVYAKNQMILGVGAGQTSRVFSTQIGLQKALDANLDLKNAVMASDAFFPFRDSIDIAAEAGITAIVQPGGSIKDPEIIAAADELGLVMIFTNSRHFRH